MRDPYLYKDIIFLRNLTNIKDANLPQKAEADITNITMSYVYNIKYSKFDCLDKTFLCNIT